MSESFQINLVIENVTYSDFLVTKVGENLYRLEEHLTASDEANFKDVIEAKVENDELIFQKLFQKSDLKLYDFILSPKVYQTEDFENLLKEIEKHNGYWTQAYRGILLVSLPNNSKFDLNEKIQDIYRKHFTVEK
jgi:hypothetical protein